ncbi:MAG: hypothetical protein COA78_12325 [Blastopirellula sp.]|nr:MAG: hypothetical protein COA78_12325 [Blastopirellula sp.]
MPIAFKCNKCSSQYRVKDELAGKKTKCPKCSTILKIPTPGAKKPAAAKPPAPPKSADPFVDDDPLGLGLSTSEPSNDIFKSDPVTPGNSAPAATPADDGFWSQSSGPGSKKSNDPLAEAPISSYSSSSPLSSVGGYMPTSSTRGGDVGLAKKRLFWPILGLRICLGLATIMPFIILCAPLYQLYQIGTINKFGIGIGAIGGVILCLQCTAFKCLNHAARLEGKGWAWFGFILVLIPTTTNILYPFTLIFAIWGIIVMFLPGVSKSFK